MTKRTTRVLLLVHSLIYGGAERIVVETALALRSKGYEVAVCTFSQTLELWKELEKSGVELYVLEKRGRFDLSLVMRLTRLMRRLRPDIVCMHCRDALHFGMPACVFARIPKRIVTEHSVGSGTSYLLNALAYQAYLPALSAIVAVSEFLKELMIRKWHLPAERIRVIYNGIDFSGLKPRTDSAGIRNELGVPPDATIVGNVATLKSDKGLDDFLDIAARIAERDKSVHFVLVGSGPLDADLRSRAAQLGLSDRVHFMGTRKDIADLLSGFDVFLCTSKVETFGLAVVEAMYLCVPVVAFDVGSLKEVIKDGADGFLIEPGNVEAATMRIVSLLRDSKLRKEIGHTARESVKNRFSIDTMILEYETLFA